MRAKEMRDVYPSSAIGCLMREHRVIERVMPALAQIAREARDGHADARRIDRVTDFIRSYADRCHHGKEEDILFRDMATMPLEPEDVDMMDDLVRDHVYARGVVARLVEANELCAKGDRSTLGEVAETLETLVRFYPPHIVKEDTIFFRRCIAYLSKEHRDAMFKEFEVFDRDLIHEKYLGIAELLERG